MDEIIGPRQSLGYGFGFALGSDGIYREINWFSFSCIDRQLSFFVLSRLISTRTVIGWLGVALGVSAEHAGALFSWLAGRYAGAGT
jgi:hypothetical protein